MKQNMIKHFLNLYKNGGKIMKYILNEDEIVLCDGYFFFIEKRGEILLNENLFFNLDKDIFSEIIADNDYTEGKIACYLPTYRKNKLNILIKNINEDRLDNRVIIDGEKLALFNYYKLKVKGQIDVVKIYDEKMKLLGGILPIRCDSETYKI